MYSGSDYPYKSCLYFLTLPSLFHPSIKLLLYLYIHAMPAILDQYIYIRPLQYDSLLPFHQKA